jgi:hypothetical protein
MSVNETESGYEDKVFDEDYYALGTILILACAIMTAVGHVTSAQSKKFDCPNVRMMLSSGVATFTVSGLTPLIGLDNR